MMRRNNTSRRVHTLSSDSIRSDEIAATDMALSRDWSRDGISDIGSSVHDRRIRLWIEAWGIEACASGGRLMTPRHGKINPHCGMDAAKARLARIARPLRQVT